MKISHRERYIFIVAGVAVVLFVLDQFALTPWLARWSQANADITNYQAELTQAGQTFDGSARANTRWKEMSGQLLKSDAPSAETQVLNAARQWAQTAGLSLTSLKPERSEKEQGFMKITIRATANGSLAQITRFIHQVQTATIPVSIPDLQISARKEGTDDLAMQIGLATIYQSPVAAAGTAEVNR